MVNSMTGFGRSTVSNQKLTVHIEMKSVNHRFFESSIKSPRSLVSFEDKIKKLISQYIHRGRLEVYITVEGEAPVSQSFVVNWSLLDQYYQSLLQLNERFNLKNEIHLEQMLKLDEAFETIETPDVDQEVEQLVLTGVKQAVERLVNMRATEGLQLYQAMRELLENLMEEIKSIEQLVPEATKHYYEKIKRRVKELVSGHVEEDRLLTEVALFADKVDITEEVTRLKSHINQFTQTLTVNDPIGRKLDFIIQEMNREANTIGSKINHYGISEKVLEIKSLIEKLKEQVQNIE
ncbi:YicC/YloC family endoribonuclease [Bacillus carboniphilus]|uniref:YicC/YloC family endoribonuclease n=1 Tax=Bacillus carboniphilus TaxID=86663 RepID=A0ABY9JW06_9BACI|nr:YicC/YloC family endoribonuclease [Bacillus carboniphilus]WLR43584.1 YicC/YloC family endoribonuclease [Bacillus carboniphilus]